MKTDLETVEQATPYLTGIIALILHLRFGSASPSLSTLTVKQSHERAELFVAVLKENIKANKW